MASGGEIRFDGGFTIADGGTLNSTDQVLYVDNGASAFMEAGNSNLITSTLYIGHSATGQFTQNGGTYTMQATWGSPYLYLGLESGSSGTYNLNGGEMLLEQLRIGTGGTGEFNQSGGVVNIAYHKYHDFVLDIGYSSGSMGTYNLSAGELDVPLSVRVAYNGTGEFNQTGGTHTIAEKLYLGYNTFGVGTYNLTDGVLTAESEYVGYYGTGVFNQSGGTSSMSYGLNLS